MSEEKQPVFVSIAVTGRIPGDEEESTQIFSNMSDKEAAILFEDHLYAKEDAPSRESVIREHSQAIFFNSFLVSDTPIRWASDPQPAPKAIPRVVAILTEGGVMETFADPGVDLVEFDWQNYLAESPKGKLDMALPAKYADLAPEGTPINATDPDAFIFKDTRPNGDGVMVKAAFNYYRDGSPAITLTDVEDGFPYATCTTAWRNPAPAGKSLEGKPQQCVWIKDYAENAGITALLVDAGILDREWAGAHSSMPGDPCPQLLTDRAYRALELAERPAAPSKRLSSLGM